MTESRTQIEATAESLRIAGENLEISTYSYNEGLVTVLDVLQAQLNWIQLYTNSITARYDYALAVAAYERITAPVKAQRSGGQVLRRLRTALRRAGQGCVSTGRAVLTMAISWATGAIMRSMRTRPQYLSCARLTARLILI